MATRCGGRSSKRPGLEAQSPGQGPEAESWGLGPNAQGPGAGARGPGETPGPWAQRPPGTGPRPHARGPRTEARARGPMPGPRPPCPGTPVRGNQKVGGEADVVQMIGPANQHETGSRAPGTRGRPPRGRYEPTSAASQKQKRNAAAPPQPLRRRHMLGLLGPQHSRKKTHSNAHIPMPLQPNGVSFKFF